MSTPRILRVLLLSGLLAAAGLPAPAGLAAQATFVPGSPQVDDLRRLFSLAGLAFPAAGFPLSARDLADAAAALEEALPAEGGPAAALARWRAETGWQPGRTEIAINGRLAFEGYLRAGTPWEDGHQGHWAREYRERAPLYALDLSWSRPDRAAFFIQGKLRREYLGRLPATNLPGSSSGNPVALENDQVSRGYLWYDFDPLQLELGRDAVHFGPLRSALLPSSRLPFMDMLRLTLPLSRLRMDLMIASLNRAEPAEFDALPPDTLDPGYGAGGADLDRTAIVSALHRFEYDFGLLRAAVTGHVVYARPGNYCSLVDFFPVFSWHSTAYKPYNMSLVFDLEAAVLPGLRVATQFGFDDINTNPIGVEDQEVPTVPAAIVGAEYARPLEGVDLAVYVEAGWTHYLWGNFDDAYAPARAIYRLRLDRGNLLLPLTSPYGPGTAWVYTEATLERRRALAARLFGELVFRKPGADLMIEFRAHPDLEDEVMVGTLAMGGELHVWPWRWLEVYARPTWFYGQPGGWLELALGAAADLDWRRTLAVRPPAR